MSTGGFVPQADESALSGYLYKKTRDGRWQKRWFETNGVYLTYYKSKKMERLLAALSLPQVGEIKAVPQDQDPEHLDGLLTLELNSRIYTLRAKSNEEAEAWVKVLNKLRQDGINAAVQVRASEGLNPLQISQGGQASRDAGAPPKPTAEAGWIKAGNSCCGLC